MIGQHAKFLNLDRSIFENDKNREIKLTLIIYVDSNFTKFGYFIDPLPKVCSFLGLSELLFRKWNDLKLFFSPTPLD